MNVNDLKQYGTVTTYPQKYVSEVLSMPTLFEWATRPDVGNLIIAPTGSGKTHFIETVLFRHAYEQQRSVLIVTNRSALDQQIKSRILTIDDDAVWLQPTKFNIDISAEPFQAKKLQVIPPSSQSRRDQCIRATFPPLTIYIVKYQNLGSFLNLKESRSISFVVFDETHFFTSDALFNPYTGYLLAESRSHFSEAVRIYMTATPDTIIRPLAQLENLNICYFPYKTVRYKAHYFASIESILPLITQSPYQEQWLIFVNSKSEGKALKKALNMRLEANQTTYLDSTSKKSKTWRKIVSNSTFDGKVLICTSVLDNGVNLSEQSNASARNIRHIVLPPCEHDTFMQMLGRKRIPKDSNPEIHLYIQTLTPTQLNHHKQTALRCSNAICEWLQLFSEPNRGVVYVNTLESAIVHPLIHMTSYNQPNNLCEFTQPSLTHALLKKYWKWADKDIQNLFHVCSVKNTVTLSLNKLAVYRLYMQQELFRQLESNIFFAKQKGEDALNAFPKISMKWIGLDYKDGEWINSNCHFHLIEQEILKEANQHPMDKDEFNEFSKVIFDKYLTIPRIDRRGIGIKHDGKNNMSDLNKLLSHIHTLTPDHPKYKFYKRNNQFILEIDKEKASEDH